MKLKIVFPFAGSSSSKPSAELLLTTYCDDEDATLSSVTSSHQPANSDPCTLCDPTATSPEQLHPTPPLTEQSSPPPSPPALAAPAESLLKKALMAP
ncbi:hypothetical protein L1887_18912 [Cichorium endivia]|nr:hypothetical protein L1887_18912 [Cichorium endivia]